MWHDTTKLRFSVPWGGSVWWEKNMRMSRAKKSFGMCFFVFAMACSFFLFIVRTDSTLCFWLHYDIFCVICLKELLFRNFWTHKILEVWVAGKGALWLGSRKSFGNEGKRFFGWAQHFIKWKLNQCDISSL